MNREKFLLTDNSLFILNQIENTLNIIEKYHSDSQNGYTVLQNSLLSFVVLPIEDLKRKDRRRVWEGNYKRIANRVGFTESKFLTIEMDDDNVLHKKNNSMYSFMRYLRNAIAHQNINITLKGENVEQIEFFNIYPLPEYYQIADNEIENLEDYQEGIINFKISFTYDQLYNFSTLIANNYIDKIRGEEIRELMPM